MEKRYLNPRIVAYDNTVDAWVPELWAQESLAILEENMVAANLVNRDFEDEIQLYGDTVNTRRPGTFTANRKGVNDDVTIQDATATNVPIVLDQLLETTFMIRDFERSIAFQDLIERYLQPAALSLAQAADRVVLGQMPQFINNVAGTLGGAAAGTIKGYILDARKIMNDNKAYMGGRNMILTSATETEALKVDLFVSAEQVGDNGSALRDASLGKKFGFQNFMCQNMSSVITGPSTTASTVNNVGGYSTGAVTVIVTAAAGMIAGEWCTIVGDDTPQRITNVAANTLTIAPGLVRAVANGAAVVTYDSTTVNLGAGYAVGWTKWVVVTSVANLQVGQAVSFKAAAAALYTIIAVDTTAVAILLDRPLDAAIVNTDVVGSWPVGEYNLGFHRNAMTLAIRPQALPSPNLADSAIVNYNGLSLRVVITYDGVKQGHLVTMDLLCGIKVLDESLGVVMLG